MHVNLLVIGGGSGGVAAARTAAATGISVAIVENDALGGTCVNRGCVPKKLYVLASEYRHDFEIAKSFAWTIPESPVFDWLTLKNAVQTEIKRLNDIYTAMIERSGATIVTGTARFISDTSVDVDGQTITADKILLAVGGKPNLPDIPGIELALSSDDVFLMDKLPQSIAVVGAGYIALEFAGFFHSLGIETHLIMRRETPLRGFDEDIRQFMLEQLIAQGMTVHTQVSPQSLTKRGDTIQCQLSNGESLLVECVLMATGRKPNTDNLGLEHTQIQLTSTGHVKTTPDQHTHSPNIDAVGDVTDHTYDLTPVAIGEARDWVAREFYQRTVSDVPRVVPTAVFSQPPVATAGLSEADALADGRAVHIYTSSFRPMAYSLAKSSDKTFMKCVVDAQTNRVLGVHIIGKDAPEMIQGFAVAIQAGATKADFDRTVGVHPSSAEELVTMRERLR